VNCPPILIWNESNSPALIGNSPFLSSAKQQSAAREQGKVRPEPVIPGKSG